MGALFAVAAGLILAVVLPIVSYLRATAARATAERLNRRLDALEARLAQGTVPAATPPAPARPETAASGPAAPAAAAAPATSAPAPAPEQASTVADRASADRTPARLETRIGARWMLYAGVVILVIGAGLFVRYAFVNQWVTEPVRVSIGVLTGIGLVMLGRRFATAGHDTFGHTLAGGGVSVCYLSVFAAVNLYALVSPTVGFLALMAITALGALQAARFRSQPLGALAVLGGYATPFLVGFGTAAPFVLLGYVALLVAGTVFLAHRGDWPALNLMSFLLTGFTVLVWGARYYEQDAYLPTELFFTLYCGLFLWVLQRMRRSSHPVASLVRLALWTTPLWYHAASLVILRPHWLAQLVYLIAVSGVGLLLSVRWEAMWPRILLWAGVVGPLLAWTDNQFSGSWLAPAVVTWLAVAGMHTAAQIELGRRVGAQLHPADVLLVPTNGLGLYIGLQAALTPHGYSLDGLLALLLALGAGGLALLVRTLDPSASRHHAAVAATLAVVALAVQTDGAWVPMLATTQAAGLVWIGLRERRTWIRLVGALLLAGAGMGLLELQLSPVPAAYDAFVNQRAALGLFVTGVLGLIAWWHLRTAASADRHRGFAVAAAVVGANLTMLVTLSTEINAFWEVRASVIPSGRAELARQMMLSATWAAYAAALTAVGIRRRYPPIRYLAIAVFAVTVAKLFLVDFSQLDSVYRIVSSMALGLLLVGASYLYQRYGTRLD